MYFLTVLLKSLYSKLMILMIGGKITGGKIMVLKVVEPIIPLGKIILILKVSKWCWD